MGRAARRKHRPATRATPPRSRRWAVVLGLFLLALAVRLAFWKATPDAAWPYSAYFKGDAVVWLEYAHALQAGRAFELGLPIHPPGAAYLLSWLWDGTIGGVARLRFVWCILGALVPVFVFLATVRSFGRPVGVITAALCAVSTGLMILSTSLNNETPYLVLVAASLALIDGLRGRPTPAALAGWSALNGLACLFRVEHALYYALALAFLSRSWRRDGRMLAPAASSLAVFALTLLPWHVSAWRAIDRVNRHPPDDPAARAVVEQVEARLAGIEWDDDARARRDALPAFARANAAAFVAATVAHRGGQRVRAEDFVVLETALGYQPRPLARFPFVSLYGPLNFALANHPRAGGGFSPEPLGEPPPCAGDTERYPADLVAGLPPAQLALAYPPHLRLVNDGYALGWRWIVDDPWSALRRAGRKLAIFWSGASLGVTGYGAPVGVGGVRRAVDLAAPEGASALVWRMAVLAAALAGLWQGRRRPELMPWLLFAASKVVATVLFFGYARQGASVVPVVALLVALAAERWLLGRLGSRAGTVGAGLVALALVLDAWRFTHPPGLWLDGRPVGARDPFPAGVHQDQRLDVGRPVGR